MRVQRSDARSSRVRQHVILAGVSLSLAYLIAFLTLMNRWINFWIRGSYYFSYQAIFLTLLLIFFLVWLRRLHNGNPPGISIVLFGGAAGYLAGLLAFLLHPIFQENGVDQVSATLQFPAPESVLAFFWFPVRLLSWLFGAITGVLVVVISRRFAKFFATPDVGVINKGG